MRSSFAAPASGLATGKVAKRAGCRRIASARKPFTARASGTTSAAVSCSTPGAVSDTTGPSIPARSLSAIRRSSRSLSPWVAFRASQRDPIGFPARLRKVNARLRRPWEAATALLAGRRRQRRAALTWAQPADPALAGPVSGGTAARGIVLREGRVSSRDCCRDQEQRLWW
jgi:hypothetical protein